MVKTIREPLVDAEFYILHDDTPDEDLLGKWNVDLEQEFDTGLEPGDVLVQYDPDPDATLKIHRLREARYAALHPEVQFHPPYNIFQDIDVPLPDEYVAKTSAFKGAIPMPMPHIGGIRDFSAQSYGVVSKEWKDAIEAVEPYIHKFFPHKLQFSDGVLDDRYIFRAQQVVPVFIDENRSDGKWSRDLNVYGQKWWTLDDPPKKVSVYRHSLAGRHWVRSINGVGIYISSPLARMLHPLLPSGPPRSETGVRLIPVELVDR